MIIKVDKEGRKTISQLLDVVLKTGGMANLQGVNNIIENLEMIEEVKEDGEEHR